MLIDLPALFPAFPYRSNMQRPLRARPFHSLVLLNVADRPFLDPGRSYRANHHFQRLCFLEQTHYPKHNNHRTRLIPRKRTGYPLLQKNKAVGSPLVRNQDMFPQFCVQDAEGGQHRHLGWIPDDTPASLASLFPMLTPFRQRVI